jgi:hypothetical protein
MRPYCPLKEKRLANIQSKNSYLIAIIGRAKDSH